MENLNYFLLNVLSLILILVYFLVIFIVLSIIITPVVYGYIYLRRKKIRGFISLAIWGIFCVLISWQYFNPNVSEERYNSFMENYDERCEAVEKILNGEVDKGDGWKFELPPEYKHLSYDGTACTVGMDDKNMVFFFDHIHYMMGVTDDYSGYAYISDNAKIKDFFREFKYKKIRDNWYFVVVH